MEDARRRKTIDALRASHAVYLRGLAHRLCRSQLDPDDLVQDLFEKLMRTVDAMPAGANERAWLARMIHNLFIDKLRRVTARREDPIDEPVEPPVEARAWWESLTEEAVRAQLAQLPAEQRVTFELFAFEGKSYDQIAAQLGIAKATVGTRILRTRLRIRELLTSEYADG